MEDAHPCPRCGNAMPASRLPDERCCLVCAVTLWGQSEDRYAADGYCGSDAPGTVHTVAGDPRVVFSASSAVNYYRGPSRMPAARFTGALVEAAAELTGCTALAASSQPSSLAAAADHTSPEQSFAAALARSVTSDSFVIDVRGMRDRSFAVCVGTGPLPDDRTHAVADAVAEACSRRGLDVAVNEPFAALPPWTVAHHAQLVLGVPALQVQLSASLRDPARQRAHAQVALTALRAAAVEALRP